MQERSKIHVRLDVHLASRGGGRLTKALQALIAGWR